MWCVCVSLHRELNLGVFGSEGVRYLCVCSGTRLSVTNTFTAGNCKKQTSGFTGETVWLVRQLCSGHGLGACLACWVAGFLLVSFYSKR